MIVLHRLAHEREPFYLNPDLIVTIDANPDTVIALTTGAKIVVAEPAQEVAELILASHLRYGRCASTPPPVLAQLPIAGAVAARPGSRIVMQQRSY